MTARIAKRRWGARRAGAAGSARTAGGAGRRGQWRDGLTLERWRVDRSCDAAANKRRALARLRGRQTRWCITRRSNTARIEIPAAYTSFLQIALAATDFGARHLSGAGRAHRGRRRPRYQVDADLDNGSGCRDTRGRLWMGPARCAPLNASRRLANPGVAHLPVGQKAGAYGLAPGAAQLGSPRRDCRSLLKRPPVCRSSTVRSADPPFTGGAQGRRRPSGARSRGDMEPISMPKLAGGRFGPEFAGTLSGSHPADRFRDKLLTFGGDLGEGAVFDGHRGRPQHPASGIARPLAAAVRRHREPGPAARDPLRSRSAASPGSRGQVRTQELFAWAPLLFTPYLQTPPGLRGHKRISARAVGTLSNVGGGGGGIGRGLTTCSKMFDEYDYEARHPLPAGERRLPDVGRRAGGHRLITSQGRRRAADQHHQQLRPRQPGRSWCRS